MISVSLFETHVAVKLPDPAGNASLAPGPSMTAGSAGRRATKSAATPGMAARHPQSRISGGEL